MKLKLTIFAVLALLLLLTLAVAQTRYEQKLFSASFPAGDVEFSTQDTTSKDGLKIAVNEWNVYNGGAIYAIAYTDFPTERNAEELDNVIAGQFREFSYSKGDSFIGSLKGRAGSGFGLRDGGKLYIYTRAALSEDHKRLWQLYVMSLEPLTLARINSFFDSVVIK